MAIPLWVLLLPLALVVAFTALFLFFNVFHLARYGIAERGAGALIVVYVVSYAIVLVLGVGVLGNVVWSQTVPIRNLFPSFGSSPSTLFDL